MCSLSELRILPLLYRIVLAIQIHHLNICFPFQMFAIYEFIYFIQITEILFYQTQYAPFHFNCLTAINKKNVIKIAV